MLPFFLAHKIFPLTQYKTQRMFQSSTHFQIFTQPSNCTQNKDATNPVLECHFEKTVLISDQSDRQGWVATAKTIRIHLQLGAISRHTRRIKGLRKVVKVRIETRKILY